MSEYTPINERCMPLPAKSDVLVDRHPLVRAHIQDVFGRVLYGFACERCHLPANAIPGAIGNVDTDWRCPNDATPMLNSQLVAAVVSTDLDAIDRELSAAIDVIRCGRPLVIDLGAFQAHDKCNDLLGHRGLCGLIVGTIVNADGKIVRGRRPGDGPWPTFAGETWRSR